MGKGRSNTRMYILVGLLLAFMALYVLLPVLTRSSGSDASDRSSGSAHTPPPTTAPVPDENIDFQKEGTLDFIDRVSGDIVKTVDIEISRTDSERDQGLMYRQSMKDGEAMLFIFERSASRAFWMKNTYISLDIIYVDDSLEIVSIAKNTKPLSQQSVRSEGAAMYVVEVPGGFTEAYGIDPGDRIAYTID